MKIYVATALLLLSSSAALAQQSGSQQTQQPPANAGMQQPTHPQSGMQQANPNWGTQQANPQTPQTTAEALYTGWRAEGLIDQSVIGSNGNYLGEVHDLVINTEGRITAIIVEGGGFLDIGDSHFRVPWSHVSRTPGRQGVTVNFTEQQAERMGLYDGSEQIVLGVREYRISELLNDYVNLRSGVGFGFIDDVVFNNQGQIAGVLVNRDARWGRGVYGYPYYGYGYGYGWNPGTQYLALPFDDANTAVATAPRIDKNRFADRSTEVGSNRRQAMSNQAGLQAQGQGGGQQSAQQAANVRQIPVSTIDEQRVYNTQGQVVGEVDSIRRGPDGYYAVVEFEETVGLTGGARRLIPLNRLQFSNNRMVLSGQRADFSGFPVWRKSLTGYRELEGSTSVPVNSMAASMQ